jgi:vacuolar-type H+-ATPase subunit F/Vma7
MKKIGMLLIGVMMMIPGFSQDDAISRFFNEYEGREDFTTIYITSRMFGLIAQIPESENEEDVMNLIRKLKGLKILTTDEYGERDELYNEALKKLPKEGFEELMLIKEGKEEIKFLISEKDGNINEFLMLIGGDDAFFLMSMVGTMTLEDISKLSKTMDIDGFEHLDKLKENKENK